MLNRITANGWKQGRIDLELGGVNLLVGGNGAGKSSVFDAVYLALFGRTPVLGKANQSLAKGMNQELSEAVVKLTSDECDRQVSLKRKGQSISKSSNEDLDDPEVPVSVEELRAMSAADLRTLMSTGGSYDAESFRSHIAALINAEEMKALHRCIIQGAGGLETVDLWVQSIGDQEKAEASNLRESKAALANIEKVIANMKPVPAAVLAEWEKERAGLFAERGQLAKLAADQEKLAIKLTNAKADLDAAKKRAEAAQEHAKDIEAKVRHIRSLHRVKWDEADARMLMQQAERIREQMRGEVEILTKRSQASKLFDTIVSKVKSLIDNGTIDKSLLEHAEAIVMAAEQLSLRLVTVDESKDVDDVSREGTGVGEAEALEAKANELLAPKHTFESALKEIRADSLEHAELILSKAKLDASVADKAVTEKENLVIELGSTPEDVAEKLRQVDARVSELSTNISNAKEYEDAVATEQRLRLNISRFEGDVEAIKAVAKAAVKVQAQYLEQPINTIRPYLDEFCEAASLPPISAAFEKLGRSVTLQIYSNRESGSVSLDALSGGEKLLIGTAFLYAINRIRNPKHKLIFVEAAELDHDNTSKILHSLLLAAEHGVQSFVTSFSPVEVEGVSVHEMAVTV